MSFVRKVYPKAVPSKASEHALLSDDVLAEAFRQYARTFQPRRRASFAPGPLEARKRASKRRIGVLAPSGTIDFPDFSFLPGFGSSIDGSDRKSKWQWQDHPQPMTQREIVKRREGPSSFSTTGFPDVDQFYRSS